VKGKGVFYLENGKKYEGELIKGKRKGIRNDREDYIDGSWYDGDFKDDM